ncbi:hypothetical protein SeLEV6574_g05580 [Synchytrium endobioticum]|uniref:Uncharacterized protein n=1 Tax=Synchytrium endobioticum TaxID=286115 RepID=A0A507CTP7_9FUNG|nr:hypothetical protein SeLEV6574_g05580 [Synchytrium endobioticum]
MGMKGSELGIFLKLRPFEVPPEMRDQGLSRISEAGAALVANRASSGKKRLLKRRWTCNPFRPLQSVGEVPRYTSRQEHPQCPEPPMLRVSPKVHPAHVFCTPQAPAFWIYHCGGQ